MQGDSDARPEMLGCFSRGRSFGGVNPTDRRQDVSGESWCHLTVALSWQAPPPNTPTACLDGIWAAERVLDRVVAAVPGIGAADMWRGGCPVEGVGLVMADIRGRVAVLARALGASLNGAGEMGGQEARGKRQEGG